MEDHYGQFREIFEKSPIGILSYDKKGNVKFQAPLNFDNIQKIGFYNPTRVGSAFIDYTISVTDSGFLEE
jgi:hypothetical protein